MHFALVTSVPVHSFHSERHPSYCPHAVTAFARKTGDLAVLSGTDLEIIALTFMMEKEKNGMKNIRSEPVRVQSVHS